MTDYMQGIELVVEKFKNNMYNNTLDGVSACIQQQQEYQQKPQSNDQQNVDAKNCTQVP